MSILSLLYRTVGAWGAGKGSRLNPAEVDENFYALETAVNDLVDNPTQANNIFDITVNPAGTELTIIMQDASTFGPFTLPTASFKWRAEWLPVTAYKANDLFTVVDGLYFVNRDFTSGSTFVPTFGTGVGGILPYASLLMPIPSKVRIAWFWPGKPGIGLPDLSSSDDFAPMFSFLVVDPFVLPANLDGSIGAIRRAPASLATYVLRKNEDIIGSVRVATTGIVSFLVPDAVAFANGDLFECAGPDTIDTDANGLSLTIVGQLGELDSSSS